MYKGRKNAVIILITVCCLLTLHTGCAHRPGDAAAMKAGDQSAAANMKTITVATVNGVPITMEALVRMMNRLAARLPEQPAPEETERFRSMALNRLVLQELAWQQATARGLHVDQENVNKALANLDINLGGPEEYAKFLAQEGLSEAELRAQIERSLLTELIFAREVLDKIEIPVDEVKKEYEKEKHRYIIPEKIIVTDVMFFAGKGGKEARRRASAILAEIRKDPEQDPWKLILDGAFIVRTLEVTKEKHAQLYAASRKLKPGGLSPVIAADDGLHIIKLNTYEPRRQLSFDEVRSSLEMKFRVPAQEKRLAEWEKELQSAATIKIHDAPAVQ